MTVFHDLRGDAIVGDVAGHDESHARELVEMSGEEGEAAHGAGQVDGDGPGQTEAVERRGAPTQFVDDHQGVAGRQLEGKKKRRSFIFRLQRFPPNETRHLVIRETITHWLWRPVFEC